MILLQDRWKYVFVINLRYVSSFHELVGLYVMHSILTQVLIQLRQVLGRLVISRAVYVGISVNLDSGGEEISLRLRHTTIVFVVSEIVYSDVLIYYLSSVVLERGLRI